MHVCSFISSYALSRRVRAVIDLDRHTTQHDDDDDDNLMQLTREYNTAVKQHAKHQSTRVRCWCLEQCMKFHDISSFQ